MQGAAASREALVARVAAVVASVAEEGKVAAAARVAAVKVAAQEKVAAWAAAGAGPSRGSTRSAKRGDRDTGATEGGDPGATIGQGSRPSACTVTHTSTRQPAALASRPRRLSRDRLFT